jgi:hypothetical protein
MIRTLTYVLALGVVALCCGPAIADAPAPGAPPAALAASPAAPAAITASPAATTASPAATTASSAATTASPVTPMAGLQAKIVTVNPRLTHHKGRQLRVFVRNRGPLASARASIRLRARPGQQSTFVTEARPLPAIAPGGEVSRSFSVPRHFRTLPPPSRLEAVVTLPGADMVLPPFTTNHAAPRPALPVRPSPAPYGPVPLK